MLRRRCLIVHMFALWLFLGPVIPGQAQTTVNPDISVIGDIRGMTADRPEEIGLERKYEYEFYELELAVQGYLNPYARGDVFLAWHGEHAEVEEAFVTFERGLPWGLSARAGRYLGNFGRLNLLHPHAFSFIERPLVHTVYFGAEGFRDDGFSLRWLLPLETVYTELSVDVLRGNVFTGGHVHLDHEHESEEAGATPDFGLLSHVSAAGALGEFSELAVGGSFAYGHHDPAENLKSLLVGGDLKYRSRPDRYTSLTIIAEGIINRRDMAEHHHQENEGEEHHEEEETSTETFFGGYGVIDYQFKQRFNVGAKFDYLQPLEDKGNTTTQAQLFVGFAPVEETSLIRLTGYYRDSDEGEGVFGGMVQLIFSLGPHRPHYF